MQNSFNTCTPLVAYTSAAGACAQSDANLLKLWVSKIPMEIDIFAEEIDPLAKERPLWSALLMEVERGRIKTLVVPSLFHIAGADVVVLAKVLTFLKANRVTLKTLTELVDSRRDSKSDILLKFIESTNPTTQGCA